ncbi:phage adaptor protein [Bradyrhizobium sp. SYSU BS000235]|uniref:phage adaptor protein n=1 Tax=Bradyrhizobium sp. SYSU BS000235 TaxID=3411332 RepID=UPI003C78C0C4
MSLANYADLQVAIAEWLGRETDVAILARVPDFIRLCEAKLNRDLRSNKMELRATATVNMESAEPEFITLPGDFQTMRRVRLSSLDQKPRLEFMNGRQADEFRTRSGNAPGRPQFFTIFGDELELIRTPDMTYTLEMVYRANIPALSNGNPSNWLLTTSPDIYLYGALLETAPYIKEDERLSTWAAGFKYALDSVNQLARDQAYNAGPMTARVSGATP